MCVHWSEFYPRWAYQRSHSRTCKHILFKYLLNSFRYTFSNNFNGLAYENYTVTSRHFTKKFSSRRTRLRFGRVCFWKGSFNNFIFLQADRSLPASLSLYNKTEENAFWMDVFFSLCPSRYSPLDDRDTKIEWGLGMRLIVADSSPFIFVASFSSLISRKRTRLCVLTVHVDGNSCPS